VDRVPVGRLQPGRQAGRPGRQKRETELLSARSPVKWSRDQTVPDTCLQEEPPVNYISLTTARLAVQYVVPEQCQAEPWGFHKGSSTFHLKAYILVNLYTAYVCIPSNYLLLTSVSTRYMQSDTVDVKTGEFK
jgi:hypothetical protein